MMIIIACYCYSLPSLLLFAKAAQAKVKVLPCVAMETMSDDGHAARVAPVLPVIQEKLV